MKSIYTLVEDIYDTVGKREGWFDEALAKEFSGELGSRLVENFGSTDQVPRLRLSQMGPRCHCALWHSIHSPEHGERLPAHARIKYTYGHIIEALVIAMAKASGHEVTGEQDELWVDGIRGHRDCVIDGCIVDVKSTSSLGFKKFQSGSIRTDDPFGYLDQLDGYLLASREDPLVRVKNKGYLLAVDKTLGHLALYEHTLRETSIRERVRTYKDVVALDRPPPCTCETVPDGKSGNIKLGTRASYSPQKYLCWPHLRTFLYASGPTFLTKVVRKPDVTEVDKNGKVVYNG